MKFLQLGGSCPFSTCHFVVAFANVFLVIVVKGDNKWLSGNFAASKLDRMIENSIFCREKFKILRKSIKLQRGEMLQQIYLTKL